MCTDAMDFIENNVFNNSPGTTFAMCHRHLIAACDMMGGDMCSCAGGSLQWSRVRHIWGILRANIDFRFGGRQEA